MKQLVTRWGRELDKQHILEDYPRPMMERKSYVNLNGTWNYAFTKQETALEELCWEGEILVPFSPEAYLSGVNRQLQPGEYLWYQRSFAIPEDYREGMRVLLHFGAVDQRCKIYVNHKRAAAHIGGYLPFTADITALLVQDEENELIVCVRDDSETSYYSRGKQMLKRGGMFYTAQSGIWQTVWMECVPEAYIQRVDCRPDADTGEVHFTVHIAGKVQSALHTDRKVQPAIRTEIEIFAPAVDALGEERFAETIYSGTICSGTTAGAVCVAADKLKLWTVHCPYLYYYQIRMGEDSVTGYFAFRTFSVEPDDAGVMRMCLNHKPCYQKGVLDQGYWPDGLYTAPSDEALIYDIIKMKELGFNMLRKHIKIEPQRWYYHCDRLGMIVWQDMVNGGGKYQFWFVTYLATLFNMFNYRIIDNCYDLLARRDKKGRAQFEVEMEQTVKALWNHPSICTWVIFNEGWGQFDAKRMTKRLRQLDSSRIIDSTSGWFDQRCGDLRSQHYYFFKLVLAWDKKRAMVLSEIGGYPYQTEGHTCCEKVYGYHPCKTKGEFLTAYQNLMENIIEPEKEKGLSATVYTQLSDVEEEVNGILTYDREVCKFE